MDQGLFKKHIINLQKIKDEKQEVLNLIKELSGVYLQDNEILVSKKNITIQTSSVKRSFLLQKKVKEFLKEKGYETRI